MTYDLDNILVRDSILNDVGELAGRLCKSDVTELKAIGVEPYEALEQSFYNSTKRNTLIVDGKVIAMFGLAPDDVLGTKAKVWILCSNELNKIRKRFARHSIDFIKEALNDYQVLYNYIDVRNEDSIKWIKWLGAKFQEKIPYGLNGEEFYYFEFSKKQELMNVFNNRELSNRDRIDIFEQILSKHPGATFDENKIAKTEHLFSEGIYTRTLRIPKGVVLTGKIHRQESLNILLEGEIEIYSNDKGAMSMKAPAVFVAPAGQKKAGYTLTDTVWMNVLPNPDNTKDIKVLENRLVANSYKELEQIKRECIA